MSRQPTRYRFSNLMTSHTKWVAMYFIFVMVMGGCMGFMSSAIAQVAEHQQWANVLSGALGAAGAFGFELVIKRLIGAAGP